MQDIGFVLNDIMRNKQCSPICAFFLLSEKKAGDKDVLYKLQSKSDKKVGRRLRDTGDL